MKSNCIIAIVDDDEAIREALNDILRSYGYESRTFSSAEDFLTYSDWSSIDCILLDVKMPGLSGLELQEVLREVPFTKPIVFMTSHQEDFVRHRADKGGAYAFLGKPVDMELLLALLERLFRNR